MKKRELLAFKLALSAPLITIFWTFWVFGALGISGCATTGASVGAGAAAGGVAGAGIGAVADPGPGGKNRFRNVVIGTAVGSAVGATAGFMMDRHVQNERDQAANKAKEEATRETEAHAFASSSEQPRLIPAKTEARWVGDQVRGTTFIPGHFEYFIVESARWESGK